MLGKGNSKKLLDEAGEQGIDVLVMFQSKVRQNVKTQLVNNETHIVIWDVRRRTEILKTKSLDNIMVQTSQHLTRDRQLLTLLNSLWELVLQDIQMILDPMLEK